MSVVQPVHATVDLISEIEIFAAAVLTAPGERCVGWLTHRLELRCGQQPVYSTYTTAAVTALEAGDYQEPKTGQI